MSGGSDDPAARHERGGRGEEGGIDDESGLEHLLASRPEAQPRAPSINERPASLEKYEDGRRRGSPHADHVIETD